MSRTTPAARVDCGDITATGKGAESGEPLRYSFCTLPAEHAGKHRDAVAVKLNSGQPAGEQFVTEWDA